MLAQRAESVSHSEPRFVERLKLEAQTLEQLAGPGMRISLIFCLLWCSLFQVVYVLVQPLDVVVVRPLRLADGALVADDGYAVLAQRAVHVAVAVQGLFRAIGEGLQQQR